MVVAMVGLGCGGADAGAKYDPFAAIVCLRHLGIGNSATVRTGGTKLMDVSECRTLSERVGRCCADAATLGMTPEVCAMIAAAGVAKHCDTLTSSTEMASQCADGTIIENVGLFSCQPIPP